MQRASQVAIRPVRSSGQDIFALDFPNGLVIATSSPSFGKRMVRWPAISHDPSYFGIMYLRDAVDVYLERGTRVADFQQVARLDAVTTENSSSLRWISQ
jgi:hypothetical protein